MRSTVSRSAFAVVVLGIAVVGLLARQGAATNPTVPGKATFVAPVSVTRLLTGTGSTTLLTVPGGRRLIVTDVVAATLGPEVRGLSMFAKTVNGGLQRTELGGVLVAPNQTFAHTFGTGLEFRAGEQVVVTRLGEEGQTFLTLRGYYSSP